MTKYQQALALIEAAHAEDPQGRELDYARHMSAWLDKLEPQASEALRLAVRCQHLQRWKIQRSAYPEGRVGYLRWRKEASLAHAALAGELLGRAGYGADTVARVQSLVKKEGIKHDPEAQALEDVTCLVFLEHELAAFAPKHEEAKVVDILQKTWLKMSPAGREAALGLKLPAPLRVLVEKAVSK